MCIHSDNHFNVFQYNHFFKKTRDKKTTIDPGTIYEKIFPSLQISFRKICFEVNLLLSHRLWAGFFYVQWLIPLTYWPHSPALHKISILSLVVRFLHLPHDSLLSSFPPHVTCNCSKDIWPLPLALFPSELCWSKSCNGRSSTVSRLGKTRSKFVFKCLACSGSEQSR